MITWFDIKTHQYKQTYTVKNVHINILTTQDVINTNNDLKQQLINFSHHTLDTIKLRSSIMI